MGFFDLFRPKPIVTTLREDQMLDETVISDPMLRALLTKDEIDRETVLNIPAISACVNRIADTVASLEVKLYKREDDTIKEIEDDPRIQLLNRETGDTLDGSQFKKAMVIDMYLEKGGYAFVYKTGGEVESIHYVDARRISFQRGTDPIFKDYRIICNGIAFEGWQWVKLLRSTQNGYEGRSIIEESPLLLNTVYASQEYEKNMVKTGGNKKGFIQSTVRLTKEAMTALKNAFRNLYSNNSENVVILNDGLSFKESSNSAVELQLNENKKTNSDEICKIFLVPPAIINGGATEEDKKLFYEGCILPILERFETAINNVLLTEDEKSSFFFAFDTTDLTKSDIEKRFKAYEIACKNGFMQVDEVRRKEKLPALELDFIKLGLQDVLYFTDTKQIYTPNTNKLSFLGEEPEGVETEDPGEQSTTLDDPPEDQTEDNAKGGEVEDEN